MHERDDKSQETINHNMAGKSIKQSKLTEINATEPTKNEQALINNK